MQQGAIPAPMPYQPGQSIPGYPMQQQYMPMPGMQYVPVVPLPQQQAPAPAPAPAAPVTPAVDATEDVTKLPVWAQKEITGLRDESAKRRIQARTAVVTQHAQAAAAQFGVDPARLLGSAVFAAAAEQLDPTAPDFAVQLTGAIYRAATAHPWVMATPAVPPVPGQPVPPQPPVPPVPVPPTGFPPGWYPPLPVGAQVSGGNFPGGNGAPPVITEAQLKAMSSAEIAKALAAGQLSHLL